MSSTAIVSRILSEKTELGQPHGQMAMGVLLMQDIAVVPLMILIPALAGGSEGNLWGRTGLGRFENVADLGHFVRYRQPCDVALVQTGCQTQIVRTIHDQRFAGLLWAWPI